MKNKDILGFDDRWLLVIGIPFVGLILSSVLFSQTLHEGGSYFFYLCYPVSILYTGAFWMVFRTIIIQLRKLKSLQHNTRRRVITETVLILIAFFALKPVLEFISDDLLHLDQNVQQPSPTLELFSALIISFFILAVYEIIYIQKQLERSMLEQEQLSRVNMQTQLEGLKNQIQPHFLFNSLNALAGLIPENPERAVRYVKKLSDVFRYILEIRNESLIQLREELSFLEAYIFLLKERFGEDLQVHIDIEEAHYDDMVVPLSLQILFENAIKHNVLTHDKPLQVLIYVNEHGKLTVENNLQPKEIPASASTRIGLENIKQRYSFIIDESVDIITTLESFIVSLPLVSAPALRN